MFYQVRRYYSKKFVDWCKFAIQLQLAGLSTFGDTVGKILKFHYTGKIWKNKIIPFSELMFGELLFCERLFLRTFVLLSMYGVIIS